MKAKKSLLLAALVLALLVLALILPAAASGASDNTPVHWATWGNSTANAVPGWHGIAAFNVRELTDGSFQGFALFQTVRRYTPGSWDRASSFEAVRFGTYSGDPCVTFVVQTEGKLWWEPGKPTTGGEWAKVFASDGGPGGTDYLEAWFDWDPSNNHGIDADWDSYGGHIPLGPVHNNISVR